MPIAMWRFTNLWIWNSFTNTQFTWDSNMDKKHPPWWRHQMETFPALLAICAGNSPWRGALMFSLIVAQINGWVNNREAGDLRRHRANYDVIVRTIYLWHNFSAMPSFNGGWIKPILKSWHGWVTTDHCFIMLWSQSHGQTWCWFY